MKTMEQRKVIETVSVGRFAFFQFNSLTGHIVLHEWQYTKKNNALHAK